MWDVVNRASVVLMLPEERPILPLIAWNALIEITLNADKRRG
jgi:hypothetical protein